MKIPFFCLLAVIATGCGIQAVELASPVNATVDNSGAVKLMMASSFGGTGKDRGTGVGILADGSVVFAGNGSGLNFNNPVFQCCSNSVAAASKSKGEPADGGFGFVVKLSSNGSKILSSARFGDYVTTRLMRVDQRDQIWVLVESSGPVTWPNGVSSTGACVISLNAELSRVAAVFPAAGAQDFGIDSNGDLLLLVSDKLIRIGSDGKQKWASTWKAHGGNRPSGIAVCQKTGNTSVIGYGMTNTGKEPYKDPYAYCFDREGKEIWRLWNPDPKKEKATQFSTPEMKCNGLMADTTGRRVSAYDGKFYLMLYADGGNSVCTRDPLDVDQKLDASVHEGAFQKTAGFGFKGASKTAVIFRADAATGKLEKGTWMCAWLSKQRANGLAINDASSDGGLTFVTGSSASGCPIEKPWFSTPAGDLPRGGYLAVFTPDFKMLQCGTFPGADFDHVVSRNGVVAAIGTIRSNPDPQAAPSAPPVFSPIQPKFGGESDAFVAVFKVEQTK